MRQVLRAHGYSLGKLFGCDVYRSVASARIGLVRGMTKTTIVLQISPPLPAFPYHPLFFSLAIQRTAPSREASSQPREQGPGLVTDGSQLPFDGATDAYGGASFLERKSLPPEPVDA